MDKGADSTQKLVVGVAIILGVLIVSIIGYSLYTKAKLAESQLANKTSLDEATSRTGDIAGISLTGEARNSSTFSYDGLIQRRNTEATSTNNFEAVNENIPEETTVDNNEFDLTPMEIVDQEPVEPTPPNSQIITNNNDIFQPTTNTTANDDGDKPLTYEEILSIRKLPIENSPSGYLQRTLEKETNGEYTARK